MKVMSDVPKKITGANGGGRGLLADSGIYCPPPSLTYITVGE